MNTFLRGPLSDTARNLMRRVGYGEHRGREAQLSYVRRLQGTPYPRFHAYVEDRDGGMQINLHLDQKEASHAGSRAHSGEYGGALVEREMGRIVGVIKTMGTEGANGTGGTKGTEESNESKESKDKVSFLKWLFG